jgi:hypothetical protein
MAKAQVVPSPASPPSGGPWEDFQQPDVNLSLSKGVDVAAQAQADADLARKQKVSNYALSPNAPKQPTRLGDFQQFEWGEGYHGVDPATGKPAELRINPAKDFVARDPETGKLAVYARHERSAGAEAEALTNQPRASGAQGLLEGMVVGPIAGIQRSVQALGAAERAAQGARAVETFGTKTGAAMATERAAAAARDAQAFKDLDVRRFGPAFNQGPVASIAKQLTETPVIGGPLRNALEESYKDTAAAGSRIADAIAPSASVEQTGAALQRGLDRYRTAGIRDLEPGVLENMGIAARAPVQPRTTMTQGAAERLEQAGLIRVASGETAQATTARGATVPAARPLNETITARRGAEDMSQAELNRIIRAPSADTSFAARQEALFEHAWNQIPAKLKINSAANPDLMAAVNTKNAFQQMAAAEAKAGISGGIVGGRFAGMADRVKTNVTLPDLKLMRTEIGRSLSNFGIYDARLDRSQLKHLYGAISRDIEVGVMDLANRARIQSRLGNNRADAVSLDAARKAEGALYALRRADRYTRMGMERMDRFAKLVGTENPQAAAGLLIRSALDGTKGNMQMLRTSLAVLRPEERSQVSRMVFEELGKPQASAGGIVQEAKFSMESALTRWQAMSPEARNLLFGGELKKDIDNFIHVVSRLANVEKTANRSRSGTNAMNLTALVGSAGSIAAGNIAVPLGVAGSGLAASILMSRPAYVRWMTTYAQVRAAVARSRINANTARLQVVVNRLGDLAQKDQALLPIYRAVAAENGVGERPNEQQPIEQQPRLH